MAKSNKLADILKGIGYLLPLVLVVLLMIFWEKTWIVFLTIAAVVIGVSVYWKFAVPLLLMICYSALSVLLCVIEFSMKGFSLITGLVLFSTIDVIMNVFRKKVWDKLVNLMEKNIFPSLD